MTSNYANNVEVQMRKGMIEFCTLLTLSGDPMYASEILERLKEADLIVVEGTLYPLLTRLRREDLLSYEWVESRSGPPRKYYRITSKGRQVLKTLSSTWKQFSASIENFVSQYEKNR